jgi:adenylosuccinate lyase
LGYGLVAHNLLFDPKKANEVQKETGFFGLPTHPDDWVISRDVISNSFSTLATKPKSLSGAVLVTRRFYPGGLF